MGRVLPLTFLLLLIFYGFDPAVAGERIMFVGNSLTGFNNLPGQFRQGARELGYDPEVEEYLAFGQTLAYQLSRPEVITALSTKRWDVVVLQEYSINPLEHPKEFEDSVRRFVEILHSTIQNAGARIVLFQNWPLKGVDSILDLNTVYDHIAVEFGLGVAPIGRVWNEMRDHKGLALYSDEKHPTPVGSYLASAVLLRTIYSVNTDPLSHTGSKSTTSSVVNGPLEPVTSFDLDRDTDPAIIEEIQHAVDTESFP